MADAYILDYLRTPFGRFGGSLSPVRPDDLAAGVISALLNRQPRLDRAAIDDVILGCANQAGEDNRNIARMASLLAGLPVEVPASTINRLCGSGLDALALGAAKIKSGEADLIIAGGVESMSRAPFVMPKAEIAYSRRAEIYDTTIGWRFVNSRLQALYGTETMPETAENVAEDFTVSRADQDKLSFRSHQRAHAAQLSGRLAKEIVPVSVPQLKGDTVVVERDEQLRPDTSLEALSSLPTPFRKGGTVTAGNASGINDGAAALVIASEKALERDRLIPMARVVGSAVIGIEPRIMGFGPALAARKLMERYELTIDDFDIVELNEAFASQVLAVSRALGLADDSECLNPNGGAIALGHPLGASGARIAGTAILELKETNGKRALIAMCIGVGQGIAMAVESV